MRSGNSKDRVSESGFTSLKKFRSSVSLPHHHSFGLADQQFGCVGRVIRWALPETTADGFSFFLRRNKFDAIITQHPISAFVFGLLTRIFGRRSLNIVKQLFLHEEVLRSSWRQELPRLSLTTAE